MANGPIVSLVLPILLASAVLVVLNADAAAAGASDTAGEAQRRAGYESFRLKRGYHFFRLRKAAGESGQCGGISETDLLVLSRLVRISQTTGFNQEDSEILRAFLEKVKF